MGEDWLLALQDEFTKSYFLQVCRRLPMFNIIAENGCADKDVQLKEFVTAEQRTKKVFPPGQSTEPISILG